MESYQENDESVKVPKIVDLNDFCLINIFEGLDVQSLLQIVDANKGLQPAALDVYKRKFDAKTVNINEGETAHGNAVEELKDVIQIRGLKASLQFLRCFGPFIHGVSIGYNDSKSKRYDYLHEYINNFCAETLVRIAFEGMPNIAVEQFKKIFGKIEEISFVNCELGEKWASIIQWFPNLRRLNFDGVRMVYRSIEKPFRNLEHLSIKHLHCDGFNTIKIAADLLDGIKQLKSLEIDESKMSIIELLDLIKDNPSITKLSACEAYGPVTSTDVQRLISEHPSLIDLDLECYKFTPDDVIALTRQLGSLKQFEFYTQVNYFSNERSDFESQLDTGGWDIFVGQTGCDLRTFRYDMWTTINRRA